MEKDLMIQVQQDQLHHLVRLIGQKDSIIELLEARIEVLENNQKKDSSNSSSKPPGCDNGKIQRTKSLRIKSGKKAGG